MLNFAHNFHLKLAVAAGCDKSVYKICANISELLTHTYWGHESVKHHIVGYRKMLLITSPTNSIRNNF